MSAENLFKNQGEQELPKQQEQENIYDISQERHVLRKERHKIETIKVPKKIIEENKEELKLANEKAGKFHIKDVGGMSEAKKLFREQKEKSKGNLWIDENVIAEEIGPNYQSLSALSDEMAGLLEFELSQMREAKNDPYVQKVFESRLSAIAGEKSRLENSISEIENKNFPVARAYELTSFAKGLHQEGHICPTPSVKKYLEEIGVKMVSGKPMFLFGHTGTGKTSLARFAAKHFTGQDAEIIYCTPQTREANIWGKTGLRPTEGEAGKHGAIKTVFHYGPLAKAIKEGKVCIFDEFNALPEQDQLFIKSIFGKKPGELVNVPGNDQVEMQPGFQMIFTSNLKSEKHSGRQELLNEVAREFEQNNLKVEYNPEDEAYDIMLARLMNKDGSVDMSYYDLNETLPRLANALAEIQIAYSDKMSDEMSRLTGTQDVSGKASGLKKFVMTQGTIEVILDDWKTEKQLKQKKLCFAEFLDSALKRGLTFEEYPEKDRISAAKILASKGFLITLSAKDINLPDSVFDFSLIKKMRGENAVKELREKSSALKHIPIKELVKFDPFEKRKVKAVKALKQFLETGGEEEKFEGELSQEINQQYERQKEILLKAGILQELSTGELGIEGIDGKEYAIPTKSELAELIEQNKELLEIKQEQGFKKFLLVPFGVSLDKLAKKYGQVIIEHFKQGKLFDSQGNQITNLRKQGEGDSVANDATGDAEYYPFWKWEKYTDADINGDIVYYPKQFSKTNHGGKTKKQILEEQKSGWNIILVEDLPNIPRKGNGAVVGNRKQFEAGETPNDYLKILSEAKIGTPYYGEQGMTPEDQIMYSMICLEETNKVIDDYQTIGSISYQVGSFYAVGGVVPFFCWSRGNRRAFLGGDVPGYRGGDYGFRSAAGIQRKP